MISKKELLKEMNISYGQLYRWKREGLIPDDWFIKQSAPSGQETYFNRDKIIPRIEKILELKDKYQLEQLKSFFCPDVSKRVFSIRELLVINDIDPLIARGFSKGKTTLTIFESVMIYILSKYQDVLNVSDYYDYDFNNIKNINKINIINYYFYILQLDGFYILISDDSLIIDKKIKIYEKIKIEDIAKMIAENLG